MKRVLVFVFALIITTGFSQSNEEMKFVNRNKIEYNGEIINLKKAMELSEGVSEDAKFYFKWARLHPIRGVIFITVPLLTRFGIDLIERESYFGGVACLYLAGAQTFSLINPDEWKTSKIEEGIKAFNEAKKG